MLNASIWTLLTIVVPISPLIVLAFLCFLTRNERANILQVLGDGQVIFYAVAVFAATYADAMEPKGVIWDGMRILLIIFINLAACLYTAIAFDHMDEAKQTIAPERAAAISSIAAVCAAVFALLIHFILPR